MKSQNCQRRFFTQENISRVIQDDPLEETIASAITEPIRIGYHSRPALAFASKFNADR
jgi:hypothetical protein